MTRKDYEMIAKRISEAVEAAKLREKWSVHKEDPVGTLDDLAAALGGDFHAQNPNFDRTRFMAACGL
jgi:hypothetical protein